MAKQEYSKKRRNFLPTILITIFLWVVWGIIFFLLPPEYTLTPFLFILTSFLSVLFPMALVFGNTRRGLLCAIGVVMLMGFSYYGMANILNIVLLLGILIVTDYYLVHR